MYRYSNNTRYRTVMRSHRYQPVLFLIIIAIAVVVVLKLVGVGSLNETNYEQQRNSQLRTEVQNAVSQANQLSRLGATTTSNALGKIRAYIHGIEVINELNVSMYGEVGRLFEDSIFEDIYEIIDDYESDLSTGTNVSEVLNELTDAVDELNDMTLELIGATSSSDDDEEDE